MLAKNSLLFCATTFLSIYTYKFYEWNGRLPGYDKGITNQNIDPDKAAFSTAPHDEEAYSHVPMNDHDDPHDPYSSSQAASAYDPSQVGGGGGGGSHVGSAYDDTSYAGGRTASHGSGYSGATGVQDNPFRQDNNPFDDDHEYGATPHQSTANLGLGRPYVPPTAEEYDDAAPVQFPAANYDRVVR